MRSSQRSAGCCFAYAPHLVEWTYYPVFSKLVGLLLLFWISSQKTDALQSIVLLDNPTFECPGPDEQILIESINSSVCLTVRTREFCGCTRELVMEDPYPTCLQAQCNGHQTCSTQRALQCSSLRNTLPYCVELPQGPMYPARVIVTFNCSRKTPPLTRPQLNGQRQPLPAGPTLLTLPRLGLGPGPAQPRMNPPQPPTLSVLPPISTPPTVPNTNGNTDTPMIPNANWPAIPTMPTENSFPRMGIPIDRMVALPPLGLTLPPLGPTLPPLGPPLPPLDGRSGVGFPPGVGTGGIGDGSTGRSESNFETGLNPGRRSESVDNGRMDNGRMDNGRMDNGRMDDTENPNASANGKEISSAANNGTGQVTSNLIIGVAVTAALFATVLTALISLLVCKCRKRANARAALKSGFSTFPHGPTSPAAAVARAASGSSFYSNHRPARASRAFGPTSSIGPWEPTPDRCVSTLRLGEEDHYAAADEIFSSMGSRVSSGIYRSYATPPSSTRRHSTKAAKATEKALRRKRTTSQEINSVARRIGMASGRSASSACSSWKQARIPRPRVRNDADVGNIYAAPDELVYHQRESMYSSKHGTSSSMRSVLSGPVYEAEPYNSQYVRDEFEESREYEGTVRESEGNEAFAFGDEGNSVGYGSYSRSGESVFSTSESTLSTTDVDRESDDSHIQMRPPLPNGKRPQRPRITPRHSGAIPHGDSSLALAATTRADKVRMESYDEDRLRQLREYSNRAATEMGHLEGVSEALPRETGVGRKRPVTLPASSGNPRVGQGHTSEKGTIVCEEDPFSFDNPNYEVLENPALFQENDVIYKPIRESVL